MMYDFLGTERFVKACNDEAWEILMNGIDFTTKIPKEDGEYSISITVYSEEADMDVQEKHKCLLSTEGEMRYVMIFFGKGFAAHRCTVEKFKENFKGYLFYL